VRAFGGPDVLQLADVPDPAADPGQVVLRVHAAGVNPADTYIRAGAYPRLPSLPFIPGADAAGAVEAVGHGVSQLKKGDRVYTAGGAAGLLTGAYADLMACEASKVVPLPGNITFGAGAAVGAPYATAYHALFNKARAQPGETVFVHGASGGVGIAAVQLARARGMMVIGSAGSERGRTLIKEQGAHHVLDHTAPGYLDTLRTATAGRGPDVILEMLANVNLANDLEVVARCGRVVVIGNRGTIEINPRAAMTKDSTILGMALWNAPMEEMAAVHAAIVAGLANGTLRPVVRREFALGDAAQAHVAVLEPGAYGKLVLLP
jgi:NADPH:quinone reductase